MTETIAGIEVPDTSLVREATSLVLESADVAVFNHSRRVFFWGMLQARSQARKSIPNLPMSEPCSMTSG